MLLSHSSSSMLSTSVLSPPSYRLTVAVQPNETTRIALWKQYQESQKPSNDDEEDKEDNNGERMPLGRKSSSMLLSSAEKKRKRRRRVLDEDEYDITDPFIDDSDNITDAVDSEERFMVIRGLRLADVFSVERPKPEAATPKKKRRRKRPSSGAAKATAAVPFETLERSLKSSIAAMPSGLLPAKYADWPSSMAEVFEKAVKTADFSGAFDVVSKQLKPIEQRLVELFPSEETKKQSRMLFRKKVLDSRLKAFDDALGEFGACLERLFAVSPKKTRPHTQKQQQPPPPAAAGTASAAEDSGEGIKRKRFPWSTEAKDILLKVMDAGRAVEFFSKELCEISPLLRPLYFSALSVKVKNLAIEKAPPDVMIPRFSNVAKEYRKKLAAQSGDTDDHDSNEGDPPLASESVSAIADTNTNTNNATSQNTVTPSPSLVSQE